MSAPRILIVDDNAMNIALAAFILEADKLLVESVSDPREALAAAAKFRPDLILMDIQMPEIDGLQLTRQIKGDAATRDIIVVAFTAFAMKGDEEKMRAAGCDGYLSKPIDVGTFAAQVRSHLRVSASP